MKRRGSWWQSAPAAAGLALALTYLSLVAVLVIVELFGRWGFWIVMSAAVVFPPWLRLRARLTRR